jgi:hypothetical protein
MAAEADPGLIGKLMEWGWAAISALLGVVYTMHNKRMDKIEASIVEGDSANRAEIDRQRDNVAKLFDKLEQHAQRSEDRHVEILTALHTGLSKKADR